MREERKNDYIIDHIGNPYRLVLGWLFHYRRCIKGTDLAVDFVPDFTYTDGNRRYSLLHDYLDAGRYLADQYRCKNTGSGFVKERKNNNV